MIFYDTNALLDLQERAFNEKFCVSIQTLRELETIKTSSNKDPDVKYKARKLAHLFDSNNNYEVFYEEIPSALYLVSGPDANICYCASQASKVYSDLVFCTNDIACRVIAKYYFNLSVCGTESDINYDYTGYKEVYLSDEEMANFYEDLSVNRFSLIDNQYLLIRNLNGDTIDKFYWDGCMHQPLKRINLKTAYFGDVKPINDDPYQLMAIDSMARNKLTMLSGPAGTGKSFLALSYLLKQLSINKIDKIVIFCNTVAVKGAARIGFLPGTRTEKLMESSIGNMLSSKLGGVFAVEALIAQNKLVILPMCDLRGYDTTGMKAGIYITESQNMDIELMRLALQRIGEDCIAIIDGDYEAQVDMVEFSGNNNGMKRMSEVFRGNNFYGEIKLKNIYRSKIATLAQEM